MTLTPSLVALSSLLPASSPADGWVDLPLTPLLTLPTVAADGLGDLFPFLAQGSGDDQVVPASLSLAATTSCWAKVSPLTRRRLEFHVHFVAEPSEEALRHHIADVGALDEFLDTG